MSESTRTRLSFTQTQHLLAVSADFLSQAISKGRLTPVDGASLAHTDMEFYADDVAKFGELLQKLKAGGIAAMVDIAASGKSVF